MSKAGKSRRFSLLIILPLALLTLIFTAGLLLSMHNRRLLIKGVEQEADRQLVHDLTLTQDIVNQQLRLGTVVRAQQTLAIYGAQADLLSAMIADHQGKVLASARRDQINVNFRDLLPQPIAREPLFSPTTLREIAATQIGKKKLFSKADMIAGIFPIRMAIKPGELRPTRTGFIILIRSLAGEKRDRLTQQQQRDWLLGAILAALSTGLGLSLHFFVTRRLHRIALTAGRVQEGNLEARSGVRGNDEIATLAHAFDAMVAERSRQEQTILELNQKLEERVRKRTAALQKANEELVRAEKLSTLGQLAGGVAHELRTPLGVISNAIYFLKELLSKPDTAPDITAALAESDRALNSSLHIINELLDYGKGNQHAQAVGFPVNAAIQSAIEDAKIPHKVVVTVEGDASAMAMGAPDQIERILGNLLRNAVDAMREEGEVRIRTSRRSNQIEVTVEDSGEGIPAGDLENIFEPLFSRKTTGIGLGLALCKRYAEFNNGSLVAESPPGRGALFRLTLPQAEEPPRSTPKTIGQDA